MWSRPGRKRADDESSPVGNDTGDDDEPCVRSVGADLIMSEGRAFEVNGTMTDEQRALLIKYYEAPDIARMPPIPAEFDEFETVYEL